MPKKFKEFIPIALEASKAVGNPQELGKLLKSKGVDIQQIDNYLGYLDAPIVGSMIKRAARSMGMDIEAVIKDIKSCLNPSLSGNRETRRQQESNPMSRYQNIKYKR